MTSVNIHLEGPNKKARMNSLSMDGYLDMFIDRKGKGKVIHVNPMTELIVGVDYATELDRDKEDYEGEAKKYFVYGWVIPDESFCTYEREALPNPTWGRRFNIHSGELNSGMPLSLEVYRTDSMVDEGTSDGYALAGRCQVPLPKVFNLRVRRQCGLVTPEGVHAGYIFIDLELKTLISI